MMWRMRFHNMSKATINATFKLSNIYRFGGWNHLESKQYMPLGSIYQLFHVINYILFFCSQWCSLLTQDTQYPWPKNHNAESKTFWENNGNKMFYFMSYTDEGGYTPFATRSHITYVTWELIPLNLASQR